MGFSRWKYANNRQVIFDFTRQKHKTSAKLFSFQGFLEVQLLSELFAMHVDADWSYLFLVSDCWNMSVSVVLLTKDFSLTSQKSQLFLSLFGSWEPHIVRKLHRLQKIVAAFSRDEQNYLSGKT